MPSCSSVHAQRIPFHPPDGYGCQGQSNMDGRCWGWEVEVELLGAVTAPQGPAMLTSHHTPPIPVPGNTENAHNSTHAGRPVCK